MQAKTNKYGFLDAPAPTKNDHVITTPASRNGEHGFHVESVKQTQYGPVRRASVELPPTPGGGNVAGQHDHVHHEHRRDMLNATLSPPAASEGNGPAPQGPAKPNHAVIGNPVLASKGRVYDLG
jgi:hypothetical protein